MSSLDLTPTDHSTMRETIAILLWHRFAPESHMEWEGETYKAEYLDAADAVLFRILGPSAACTEEEVKNEMIERCCKAVSPIYDEMHDEWAKAAIRENVRTVIDEALRT